MELLPIIILALIQGITEFLPISSSGHLVLVPFVTGAEDQGLLMDVAVHVGTLVAVIAYFFRDCLTAAWGGFELVQGKQTPGAKLALGLVIGTIPAVIAGFALHQLGVMDSLRALVVIGWTTLVFGIVLYLADRFGPRVRELDQLSPVHAVLVGLAQCLALVPGTSRSGITITAGRALGYTRTEAARFAMLLSIPTILGAGTLAGLDLIEMGEAQLTRDALLAACLSALAAFGAIALFMQWLKRASMTPFAVYRVVLGIILLGWGYGVV